MDFKVSNVIRSNVEDSVKVITKRSSFSTAIHTNNHDDCGFPGIATENLHINEGKINNPDCEIR